MECADTVRLIASYLTKKDVVTFSGVSRLSQRVVAESHFSYEEKQYLVWPCLKEDYVELAPPSQILALGVLGNEQRLLVLIRTGTETSNLNELECYLYTQLISADGSVMAYQKELPVCFAYPSSFSRFVGNRFLVCTTREGEIHVFDCLIETMLELPMGVDGFYAAPDGERFLLDYDRHAYWCCTTAHVACWWAIRYVDRKESERAASYPGALFGSAQGTLVETHLRAQVCPLPSGYGGAGGGDPHPSTATGAASGLSPSTSAPPPLMFYLGASSPAWRAFWVGNGSVLYANEDGVSLLKPHGSQCELMAEELPSLSPLSVDIVDSSCGDVCSSSNGVLHGDEYAVMNCRETHLYTVLHVPQRPASNVTATNLSNIIPPRVAFKGVRIAVPASTYLVYIQHLAQDRVLLLSADLTLTRWISIGRPSCFVLCRQQASLVTANLPEDLGDIYHPLVEAVEGGLGSVYTFGMRLPDAALATTADPLVSAVKVTSTVEEDGGAAKDASRPAVPQGFNGVEALSWIAFGVVSASLLWTLSALCYNGWWLHLQLLFWGKVA